MIPAPRLTMSDIRNAIAIGMTEVTFKPQKGYEIDE